MTNKLTVKIKHAITTTTDECGNYVWSTALHKGVGEPKQVLSDYIKNVMRCRSIHDYATQLTESEGADPGDLIDVILVEGWYGELLITQTIYEIFAE